ncbi:hypothetical protein BOW57_01350 [Flavobacterium sp. YO64]|nr:hypothetical protein BOW57_01350 [Flavobacterium sp. YO64]
MRIKKDNIEKYFLKLFTPNFLFFNNDFFDAGSIVYVFWNLTFKSILFLENSRLINIELFI